MEIHNYNLLPTAKSRSTIVIANIDLFLYAEELYSELKNIGIINRLSAIPQLGPIKVKTKLKKSRLDYIFLQLYFHQLIKKNLRTELKFTYNSKLCDDDFLSDVNFISDENIVTIADILQILSIIYSAGHFYNTFTSSRAVIMYAKENFEFRNLVVNACDNEIYKEKAQEFIDKGNYQRFHLLNSLLVLEQCDQSKFSVTLAKNILYSYLNINKLPENSKLHYAFDLFKRIRDFSYIAYDLQIAKTPLTIDIGNKKNLIVLFRELLSEYNNRSSPQHLVDAIGKLLNDIVYNEPSSAICYYQISDLMRRKLSKQTIDNYYDLFISINSVLNYKDYPQNKRFDKDNILKLTFDSDESVAFNNLFNALRHTNVIKFGYYNRYSGERTIVVAVNNYNHDKLHTALRILKKVISSLKMLDISESDKRYLLSVKFFLYYLFSGNKIVINPTVHSKICVICTRGKKARLKGIYELLKCGLGTEDERHEVEFIRDYLSYDTINDTSIIVPASIVVYTPQNQGDKSCEFDGIVIHPFRKNGQVCFFEAKNTEYKPSYARKCLLKKFKKLSPFFQYNEKNVVTTGHDASLIIDL